MAIVDIQIEDAGTVVLDVYARSMRKIFEIVCDLRQASSRTQKIQAEARPGYCLRLRVFRRFLVDIEIHLLAVVMM